MSLLTIACEQSEGWPDTVAFCVFAVCLFGLVAWYLWLCARGPR